MADLANAHVLVIGGAGFVGSHIVDQLLDEPVESITVLDNFVRGTRANLEQAARDDRVKLVDGSVTDVALLDRLMADADNVFHLAALWLHECVHEPRSAIEVNVVGRTTDPQEALELVLESQPDLLICEIEMPEGDLTWAG